MQTQLPPKAQALLEKLKESGDKGLTAKQMGDLFYGGEDTLYDRDMIVWIWEERENKRGKKVWVQVCRLQPPK